MLGDLTRSMAGYSVLPWSYTAFSPEEMAEELAQTLHHTAESDEPFASETVKDVIRAFDEHVA